MSETLEPQAQEPKPALTIPRGFHPITRTPRNGARVIVILQSGGIDIVEFGQVASPNPALLHVQAFHRSGEPVAVLGWRTIPRNWTV